MALSLDSVLSGKADKAEAPPEPKAETPKPELTAEAPKAETPPEPKPDKARDERGQFVKGDDVKTATPAVKPADKPAPENAEQEALSPKEKAYYAQSKADRAKRQDAERRALELQARIDAMQTPRQTPDVLADPEGFKRSIQADIETQRINDRVDLSAEMARELYPDFDEVMDEWTGIMQENPLVYQQALRQKSPAKWAYQYVKREKFLKEVGDNPDNWRKAEREKLRAELEPELKKQLAASAPPQQPVPPPSLASASSGGRVTSEPTYAGPKPFDKIFGR